MIKCELTEPSIDELREVATQTRRKIQSLVTEKHYLFERIKRINENVAPNNCIFPQNWCDYASCILALQIARRFKSANINLCIWEDEDSCLHRHWWLRIGDVDIDITADQFVYTDTAVIVERNSHTHHMHFFDPAVVCYFTRKRFTSYFERLVRRINYVIDHQPAPN